MSILLFFLVSAMSLAQQDAWVYLTSKPDAEIYLSNPLQMLSQRAIDRRTVQNIPLDITDVPVHHPFVMAVENSPGITVMARSKWMNALHVRGSQQDIAALQNLTFVASVDFANNDLNSGRSAAVAKNMELQVDFPYGDSANQIQMLQGHLLHQQGYTGQGKLIAVLDAGYPGVDTAGPFARLRDNGLILGGYNFVDRNDDIYSRSSHGTLVLSTMGGYASGQLVGTAPDSGYYLFITEDTASENPVEESLWVEAAEAADSLGVDIINSSLGYFNYDDPGYSYSFDQMDGNTGFASRGADHAFSKGILVVVSAGNSGNSPNPNIGVPADAHTALTIGAVNASGNFASFSSVGPTADGRIKPDVAAQGQGVVVAGPSGNIGTSSGTSFSSPIIAGMAASLWQAAPSLTNVQLAQVIRESAHLFDSPNFQMGYGIPNFSVALQNALLSTDSFAIVPPMVYPNPFSDKITLANIAPQAVMTLFDTSGRVLLRTSPGQSQIETETLVNGMYFYQIQWQGTSISGKLLKN